MEYEFENDSIRIRKIALGYWHIIDKSDNDIVEVDEDTDLDFVISSLQTIRSELLNTGPDGEDGPWAEGWEERSAEAPELTEKDKTNQEEEK